ncbi:MAG: protease pro-enzyme activation domain-containing protein [Fimbriimonas sp.]|nr:protease pro-enzyme activation domain-containing protein [Fimbriimonas sp.]
MASASGTQFAALPNSIRHPEVSAKSALPSQPGESVYFAISLQPRDPSGMQTLADQINDPWSPNYRQFLTPEQVGERFGPAQSDVDATVAYLTANGLTVSDVAKNRLTIMATGTAKQVSWAFKTNLGWVSRIDSNGVPGFYRTNLTALQLPAAIAGKVLSVDGLDTSIERRPLATTTQLNPTLFRACYNAASYGAGFYGQGVNIAIANWDGYRLNNIPYWTSTYGLPVPSGGAGSNIVVVKVGTGTTYGVGSPQGEGDLDLQAVLAAAPLATVYDYDDSTNDTAAPITTLSKISSDNLADIVTESYGWETSSSNTYYGSTWTSAHNIHVSLSLQGITYMAATGDDGTSAFPARGARYGYPDIDPEVLNVGGSIATVNSVTGVRSSEATWGLSGGYGGTGGFDPYDTAAHGFAFNVAPSYQTTYISSKTSKYNYRLLPDLASSAGGKNGLGSNNGTGWAYSIFYNTGSGSSYPPGTSIAIDGTSIASPATAGGLGAMMGQVFNGVTPNSSRSNVRFGRVQNYLYAIGTNSSIFYDITTGSSIGNLPGTSTAATPAAGWDYATGWGALNFGGLYNYIKSNGTIP